MSLKHYALFVCSFAVYIGCAKVQFNDTRCEDTASCPGTYTPGQIQTGTKNGGKKAVDILFVVDNSGSMSFEQNQIANRFSTFLSALESNGLDYRIGITTTDVSASQNNEARPINQNGALQDGKLIKFSTGVSYITPQTSNRVSLFASTIKRAETLACENFLNTTPNHSAAQYKANCPSPDERGIFAANMFVKEQSSSMLRSEAHFAVVFLADEDVRSQLYVSSSLSRLSQEDLPQTLVSRIKALSSNKSFSIHSIIVKPGSLVSGVSAAQAADRIAQSFMSSGNASSSNSPAALMPGGDSTCLHNQNSQMHNVSGSYGYLYALATRMTGGIEGDICASDYGSQLTNIGYSITNQVNEIELGCPTAEVVSVTFSPSSGAPSWTQVGSKIKFSTMLPANMVVTYQWRCN